MSTPPGPKPPGSPGDCDALAAVCDAYAGALDDEVRAAGRVHGVVGSGRWTGRAADYVQDAVNRWQDVARPAADALRNLADRLRLAADVLERDQDAWRLRADAYADSVRDQSRWGRT